MTGNKKMLLGGAIAVFLSAASLAYIFFRLPGDTQPFSLRLIAPGRVSLALLLMVLGWVGDALRLKLLARALGKTFPLSAGLKAVLAGNFVTLVTPFLFGGAPAVVYILTQAGLSWAEAGAVVVTGGWVAQEALAALSLAALLYLRFLRLYVPFLNFLTAGAAGYFLVLGTAGFLAYRPELTGLVLRFVPSRLRPRVHQGLEHFRQHVERLLTLSPRALGLSFSCAVLYFLSLFLVAPALLSGWAPQLPWPALACLQDAAYLVGAFAPTPGGSGVSEFGIFYIFGRFLPLSLVKEYVLWWRLLTFYLNLAAGGVALAMSTWNLFARSGFEGLYGLRPPGAGARGRHRQGSQAARRGGGSAGR